jgi:sugar transferase (PEP-CTERM/EpsH1 system associated)
MKILFVTPYIPTRPRPYELIRYLSRNHEITVVCIAQPTWASRNLDELIPFCKNIHSFDLKPSSCLMRSLAAIPSRKPMSVAYFESTRMKGLLKQLVQGTDFDLIHTEFIRAAPYTADILGIPKLFDAVDSLVLAYERGWRNRGGSITNRFIALEEWIKMRWYEPKMIRSFDRVIVSSPADKKYLTLDSGPTVDIIPNGVDNVYFNYNAQDRDENSIVFVGQMNYYVNADSILYFSQVIFPKIQKQLPKIHLSIVGANPQKSIQELAINPAIEVTGYVPDLRPYVTTAAVFVCPLLAGSGIQNKLLQAMAMGTPIVTTSVSTQALKVKDHTHLVIADDPQQFADEVVSLIANKKFRAELSVNARNYILEYHDWEKIGRKLEIIYDSLLNYE